MSGYEKYVEQVAGVLAGHDQVWRIWDHEERAVCLGCDWTSETEGHELSAAWALHMATLAIPVVGPLIEEDTRDRMVTAAGRALERDPDVHVYLSTACLHGNHQHCQGTVNLQGEPKQPQECKWCSSPCICCCHQGAAP